jgi:hypothetical protein
MAETTIRPDLIPPCADCHHPFAVHALVGKVTTEKHRGPCSSGHGPRGELCGCRQYRFAVTS